jgi:hypothetical protein
VIELRVLRPGNPEPVVVVARRVAGKWVCEDADFYSVLLHLTEPPDRLAYHPDPDLELVQYVASLYHGTVTDLRGRTFTYQPGPGEKQ